MSRVPMDKMVMVSMVMDNTALDIMLIMDRVVLCLSII
ncbi:unnamed protein product, partial [Oppiella nova]